MLPRFLVRIVLLAASPLAAQPAASPTHAADIIPAVNALGLELYREQAKSDRGGILLSPYSIGSALAMTYVGADGETKAEMQRVLRFPADSSVCSAGFHVINDRLQALLERGSARQETLKNRGEADATPLRLDVANRLYVQTGHPLRDTFVDELTREFGAPPETINFKRDPAAARQRINQWVSGITHERIAELLPAGHPAPDTRLVLVNALYFKAGWQKNFHESATRPESFHLSPTRQEDTPTMRTRRHFGYAKRDGYSVVALPYQVPEFQFVMFVPDAVDGLAHLEKTLAAADLTSCAKLTDREVILHLPKFKVAPATMPLGAALKALGLKTAFDLPRGSADFSRMTPRTPDDYLGLGEVFHKTWLSLNEYGTEAAAATAVELVTLGAMIPIKPPPPPVEVHADRPFLFAIQHTPSGVCLFLGRVTDPRAN